MDTGTHSGSCTSTGMEASTLALAVILVLALCQEVRREKLPNNCFAKIKRNIEKSWVRIPPELPNVSSAQDLQCSINFHFRLELSPGTKMSESTGNHSRAVPIMAL